MTIVDTIFGVAILIMSVVIHELSHGYAALYLGDPTAKYEGRLTINPLKHLELVGSFIVPLITAIAGMPFGWAKPVPYNPYNLRGGRWGPAIVAAAGPLSNLFIGIVLGVLLHLFAASGVLSIGFAKIVILALATNIFLACFNLIPIPPLDGSKVLFAIVPPQWQGTVAFFERYQLILMFLLIFLGWKYLAVIPDTLVRLILF